MIKAKSMNNQIYKRDLLFFAIVILLLYLIIGTGIHSDEYKLLTQPLNGWQNFWELTHTQFPEFIFALPTYYGFFWAYPVFGFEYQLGYDLIKVVAHLISLFCVYKFACDYIPRDRAMIASAFFVFYPMHDTSVYWYMCVPYTLIPSVILYAHSLMRNNNLLWGFLLVVIGAFAGYVSPPYVFGLVPIFLYGRKYSKAILFALPGVLYSVVFFLISKILGGSSSKIDIHLNFFAFLKQLIFQALSFIDAAIGPSFWLKIYYSIGSIGLISALIAIFIISILLIKVSLYSERPQYSKPLFVGLASIAILSFAMYSLTSHNPQTDFSLGNRSTIYGSLLIAFLLALLPLNKKTVVFFALIFILPVFGLSDHWKCWNTHQKIIIENIQTNKELKNIEHGSTVLVTANMYSLLGPFSHIDFFVTGRLFNSIFNDWMIDYDIFPLTSDIYLKGNYLMDGKFGGKHALASNIYVYNSTINSVAKISLSSVPQLLAQRPREIRHWVQLAKGTWIESGIVYLNPTYARLFN